MLVPNDTQIVRIWVMFELFTEKRHGNGKKVLIRLSCIRATGGSLINHSRVPTFKGKCAAIL